jgi:uncharacterized protein YggE
MKLLAPLIFACALPLTSCLGAPGIMEAAAQDGRSERWITVAGHGSVEAAPDSAQITTGVMSEASTARGATCEDGHYAPLLVNTRCGTPDAIRHTSVTTDR